MMRPVSARERRLVALLLLVALVALVWLCLIAPILDGFSARAARREELALLAVHNQRTIAAIPRLRRGAEAQAAAVRNFVADARTAEAGREQLKERLQRAIERTGGEFRDVADAEGQPGWARARVSARLTLPQLTATLAILQDSPPWLVIETLSVGANDALVTGTSSAMDIDIEASLPLRPAAAR